MNPDVILTEARAAAEQAALLRRTIHAHPERGNCEIETAALAARTLERLGFEVSRPVGTAVVGLLRGGSPGKTVALRADMDALPVEEATGLPCASRVPGVMHACGHDMHTAGLLGAAMVLADHREALHGCVKLLFQPDEEGDGGARRMIDAGCMENPHVDAVFGAHVTPDLPAGSVGFRYGKAYAASDMFTVRVLGRGCHGASPHEGVDAVAAGAQMVCALQSIVSRRVAPTDAAVVTVGAFHGGDAGNVIAETAELKGILRTLGPESRANVRRWFREAVEGVCAATGARAEIELRESYPGVVNDDPSVDFARDVAARLLGRDRVSVIGAPTMGTEDFGEFLRVAPGCFWHLGVRSDAPGSGEPLHSPRFTPDEAALLPLVALHSAIAMAYLSR